MRNPAKGGAGGTHDERDHETDRVIGNRLGKAHSGNDAAVGADAHKARVAQRQVARNADDEVKRDGHDDIGRDGNQLTGDHARDHTGVLEEGRDNEREDD